MPFAALDRISYASPAPRRRRGATGVVLGIIAAVFAFIPGTSPVAFAVGIVALIMGIVALTKRNGSGKLATILGAGAVIVAVIFAQVYGLPDDDDSATADASPVATAARATPATAIVPNVVGLQVDAAKKRLDGVGLRGAVTHGGSETVGTQSPAAGTKVNRGSSVKLTVLPMVGTAASNPAPAGTKEDLESTNRLDKSKTDYTEWIDSYDDSWTSSNEFDTPAAGKKFVAVTVHVKATTAGVAASDAVYDLGLADTAGNVYESALVGGNDAQMPGVTLGVGQQAHGVVVFEVPIAFHGGVLSFGSGTIFVKTN